MATRQVWYWLTCKTFQIKWHFVLFLRVPSQSFPGTHRGPIWGLPGMATWTRTSFELDFIPLFQGFHNMWFICTIKFSDFVMVFLAESHTIPAETNMSSVHLFSVQFFKKARWLLCYPKDRESSIIFCNNLNATLGLLLSLISVCTWLDYSSWL